MPLDLYNDTMQERLMRRPGQSTIEPGWFDNFGRGTAMAAGRTLLGIGHGLGVALSPLLMAQDYVAGTGTQAQDKWFESNDRVFGSATKYLTPKPNEVGAAGEVLGSVLGFLPAVMVAPELALIGAGMHTGADLTQKEVPVERAIGVAMTQTALNGLGIWMPTMGTNFWQRAIVGGAAFNVAQGIASRGLSDALLADTPAANEYKAFDPQALTLDALLGFGFGTLAHLSPSQRAQGAQMWRRIADWAEDWTPSQKDAVSILRQAQHINSDSLPGRPESIADVDAHAQKVRIALDQILKDEPVNVDIQRWEDEGGNLGRQAHFAPDPVKVREAEARFEDLRATADELARWEDEGGPVREPTMRVEPPSAPVPEVTPAQQSKTNAQATQDVARWEDDGGALGAQTQRVIERSPDMMLLTKGPDGQDIVVRASDMLASHGDEIRAAEEEISVFRAAAQCLIGG